MENNKFNKFYSTKTVHDLIGQLRTHRITGMTMEEEWYESLKIHLSERDLSDEERKIVEHILSDDPEILKSEDIQERKLKSTDSSLGSEKYPALRTIAGFYTFFAWIVGLVTLIMVVFIGKEGDSGILIAIPILVVGALIILGVLAVSESIKVVIDIEYNTRQTANRK